MARRHKITIYGWSTSGEGHQEPGKRMGGVATMRPPLPETAALIQKPQSPTISPG